MFNLSSLLLYMTVTMFTPGPNNLTMMYLAARGGLPETRRFFAGSAVSLLVKCLLCGWLNVLLASRIPLLVGYLKWLGAGYMLYLAYMMGRSGWREEGEGRERGNTFGAGVILQILNMKSWISCLSLFAVYVIPVTRSLSVIAGVTVLYFLFMLAASFSWGFFGSVLRRFVSAYKKPFGLIMAASLVYCAVTAVL